jgi:LacI family transcriptional regulator
MQHLLGLGHRRIGIIAPPLPANATEERIQAYTDALADAGIPFDDSLVIRGDFVFEVGVDATRKLLALDNPPTAIFATSDDMALGVLAAAREMEIRVPEDLAIAGFDDNSEASKVFPALTTIHQPLEEIARVAVQAAIEGHPIELDFQHKLIVRGSTVKAPPRLC